WKPAALPRKGGEGLFAESDGYAVILGAADLSLLSRMAEKPALKTIVFDPDAARVEQTRRALVDAGLYGDRVAVHLGNAGIPLPPYMASSILCESGPVSASTARRLFEALRPYGGRLLLRKDLVPKVDL